MNSTPNVSITREKSGRLDLNQRPFGPQPNALLAWTGAVYVGFRIPMRFEVVRVALSFVQIVPSNVPLKGTRI
jgi:hypothetical protein